MTASSDLNEVGHGPAPAAKAAVGLLIGIAATVFAFAPGDAQTPDSNTARPAVAPGFIGAHIIARPTRAQVSALYPQSALRHGIAGQAEAECAIALTGRLESCVVRLEKPAGQGFGAAALQVADLMRVAPAALNGQPIPGGRFRVPVRFQMAPPPRDLVQRGQIPATAAFPSQQTTAPSPRRQNPLPDAPAAPLLPPPPLRSMAALWLSLAFGLVVVAGIPAVRFWPQPRSNAKPPGAFA